MQFAKAKGAYVIGTASSKNQAFLRELGVDNTIDYQKARFEDVVHDLDVVLDTIGGDIQERSFQASSKKAAFWSPSFNHPRKNWPQNTVFAQLSMAPTPVRPTWPKSQSSSTPVKSNRSFKLSFPWPKPVAPTN